VPEKGVIIGVIPARYGSTRLPGKPLIQLAGKPMIQHVYERASKASLLSRVVVATDDVRIEQAVLGFGGEAVMTSSSHRTGTDRVAEIASRIEASFYVNIQGDEPLIDPIHIDECARALLEGYEMVTLAARIRWRHELFDQNVAKVVIDRGGHALMFTRSAVPFPRIYLDRGADVDLESSLYLRQIGIYGYARRVLAELARHSDCPLEEIESLEQLRALFLGIDVKVAIVDSVSPCVDVPSDIKRVENLMSMKGDG
jgi:3-deoxy-manno-octulosonate cytidylyltransferase (CMP-KDO synthetase)